MSVRLSCSLRQHSPAQLATFAALAALLTAGLAGCSSSTATAPATATVTVTVTATPTPSPTPEAPKDSRAIADRLRDSILKVNKVVTITEDNDPNDSIGRPNGYVSAAVLYDARVECSNGLGADCGATVEEWKTAKAANKRADYIQSILEDAPVLGSEYDTVGGTFVLRVAGDLKPSEAKKYQKAFSALF